MPLTRSRTVVPVPPKRRFAFKVYDIEEPVEIDIIAKAGPDEAREVIKTVLFAIHGRERNAQEAYEAAEAARGSDESVLVVAPQFEGRGQYNGLDKDLLAGQEQARLLVFKSNGWGHGGPAGGVGKGLASSFDALDRLVERYQAWPSVERLVVVGHSLGAQMVHRWSIISWMPRNKPITFVVMNPSTFLYFDQGAPYKYGFSKMDNGIMGNYVVAELPFEGIVEFFESRGTIHVLNGALDNGVGDDRPEAMAQGRNRLERSRRYQQHVAAFSNVTFDVVPGVSHSFKGMLCSPLGQQRAFFFRQPPS